MKISLATFEHNEKLKNQERKKLGLPPDIRLEFALDGVHGINEVIRSLLDLHPHKRSVAVLGAQPTPLKEIIKSLAKQGYAVQEIPVNLLKSKEEQRAVLLSSLEGLKKDTLFILSSQIEPFTGIYYPIEAIRDEIFKKNIFLIQYQNPEALKQGFMTPRHALEAVVCDPFWGEETSLSVVLKGERCLGEKLLWGESVFNSKAIENLCHYLKKSKIKLDAKKVLNFEQKLLKKYGDKIKILPSPLDRVYDRAVFFIKGVNGDAQVYELNKKKIKATTSDSCFWGDPHLNTWLPQLGLSVEESQTLVALEPKVFPSLLLP